MWRFLAVVSCLAGCDAVFGLREILPDARLGDGPGPDARVRFGTPRRIAVDAPSTDYPNDLTLTADEQNLVFINYPLTGSGTPTGARQTSGPSDPTMWPASTDLGIPMARTPKLSPDGLFIAVAIDNDVRAYRRASIGAAWVTADAELAGTTTALTTDQERPSSITADGLQIMIYRRVAAVGDAYVLSLYTRTATGEAWTDSSALLGVIRSTHPAPTYSTFAPHLTADGLTLVYSMNTHSTVGPADMWIADRDDVGEPFGPPRILAEINDPDLNDGDAWLSPDRSRLYFTRSATTATTRPADWGLYVSDAEAF